MDNIKDIENLKNECGIYVVANMLNNKKYIGQSKNIKRRFMSHHIYDYKNKNNGNYNSKFYQALRKYGLSNFKVEVIENCNINELDKKEKYWIKYFDTYKNGYNSTEGGDSISDKLFSFETELKRQKTRELHKSLKSENHPRAKLKNDEVVFIRQRYINGESVIDIHKDYKEIYGIDTFKRIVFGHSYKDAGNIPQKSDIRYTNKNRTIGKIESSTILKIRELYNGGNYTYSQLATMYNLSIGTIGKIVNKQLYKNI